MFLQLYLLLAAIALMPLPMAFQNVTQKKTFSYEPRLYYTEVEDNYIRIKVYKSVYFPYLPATITNSTFPFNLSVTTSTEIVHVKCPYRGYQHHTHNDTFLENPNIGKPFKKENEISRINWIPMVKNLSGPTQINCGIITFPISNNTKKSYNWIFNIVWNETPKADDVTNLLLDEEEVPKTHVNCKKEDANYTIVYTRNKEGKFIKLTKLPQFNETFLHQEFYYFGRHNHSEKIKEPCGISKVYKNPPILFFPLESELYFHEKENIHIFDIENTVKNIKVQLKLGEDVSFYKNEKILFQKMKYLRNRITDIDNSSLWITSNFTINRFDLIKLTHKFDNMTRWINITGIYYFGPNHDHYKFEIVLYSKNKATMAPNCTLYYENSGYLIAVDYMRKIIGEEELRMTPEKNENIKHFVDFIIFEYSNESVTKLSCIYQTPNGRIIVSKKFILITKRHDEDKYRRPNITIGTKHPKATPFEFFYEFKREIQETKNFVYEKLRDKFGRKAAFLIIYFSFITIIFATIILLALLYIKFLNPLSKMLIYKIRHPNIYEFWDMLSSENFMFEEYCKDVTDKKYLSDKIINCKVVTKIEGGETINVGFNDLFDGSVVNSYNTFTQQIKAHYVYTDSEKRKYILSDGPTKDTESCFWEMIYEENIGSIVAIIYNKKEKRYNENSSKIYWPTEKKTYKDITVTFLGKKKSSPLSVHCYMFRIEKKDCQSKTIQISHIGNWKENDIPQSDHQFVKIYEDVIKNTSDANFLFHTSHGTGSRIYMLTYFVCIYDAMMSDKHLTSPFDVIKEIREKRYGGNIGKYEFAYVIKALVSTFFNTKIIVDFSKRHSDFVSNYDNYFYDFLERQTLMDDNLKEFLNYVNIVDAGKIKGYQNDVYHLGRLSDDDLQKQCKTFLKICTNKTLKSQKIRYDDVYCLDETLVIVHGKPEGDVNGFIHANTFDYTISIDKERKLILCQAPTKDSCDDMLDMIFRYNISLVVILVTPEEAMYKKNPKWFIYFPENNSAVETENYHLTRLRCKDVDNDKVCESEFCLVQTSSKRSFNFTILHYRGWPDKSIPSEHMSIYNLYKKINSFKTDNYIAIHCSAGIGKTGTLALIMYLIDTINMFPTFNPIARLACLRRSRYLAVQKFSQFVFSILVVFEHFKKEIEYMDPGAYKRLTDIMYEILNVEREAEKEEERQGERGKK